jgi:ABC-type multidrug transport system ATPase subunit
MATDLPAIPAPASPPPPVELRALVKAYGATRALAGIDLTLEGRQVVGVVGPDGAGKTTLIRTLAGLLTMTATTARVLGYDLHAADLSPLKARIGYVPQAFGLHRDLSVMENLRFTARLQRLSAETFARRADDLLARTGLAPFINRPAGALSGGMKQKLAITNALLFEPDLLLLDEPTAGVDVLARREIWHLLERERERALVVISTSYLDEAAACDRLVYLDQGRVVAVGTPAELRAAVAFDLYRAWGTDPYAIARAAARLPYVGAARLAGQAVRVEVLRTDTPGRARVLADLRGLPDTVVSYAEALPVDMELALVTLARSTHVSVMPELQP